MESSSPTVPFPLLQTPIESNYRVCTIPYRFPSDNPRKATPVEIQWIDLFLNSVPSFRHRAENDPTVVDAAIKAEKFAERYIAMLEDMKKNPESHGGPPDCILLCRLREQILRELGFRDIFKKVKDEENAKAISLFDGVIQLNDAIEDDSQRVENLVRGILAGNIFDLGSAQLAEVFAKDGMSFLASCQNLVPRPWVIDDLDEFKTKCTKKSWKKAVIFVDNSGADVILGILPFARELLRRGTTGIFPPVRSGLKNVGHLDKPPLILLDLPWWPVRNFHGARLGRSSQVWCYLVNHFLLPGLRCSRRASSCHPSTHGSILRRIYMDFFSKWAHNHGMLSF